MDEYISREAALNLIEYNDKVCHYADKRYENVVYATTQTICQVVAEMPAADVQPVIHAYWRRGEEKGVRTYNPLWYCSNCGGQIRYDTRMRQYQKIKRPVWEVNVFCRKCGAKMEQED